MSAKLICLEIIENAGSEREPSPKKTMLRDVIVIAKVSNYSVTYVKKFNRFNEENWKTIKKLALRIQVVCLYFLKPLSITF